MLGYELSWLVLGWLRTWEYLLARNQDCIPLPPSFAAFKADLEAALLESIAAKEAENLAAIAAKESEASNPPQPTTAIPE